MTVARIYNKDSESPLSMIFYCRDSTVDANCLAPLSSMVTMKLDDRDSETCHDRKNGGNDSLRMYTEVKKCFFNHVSMFHDVLFKGKCIISNNNVWWRNDTTT